jgi:sRNA-binding protein
MSPTNSAKDRRRAEAEAVIVLLAERFPKTFAVFEQRRRPLKIGINSDVLAALNGVMTPREIGVALRFYTGNTGYLCAMLRGAWRIDLDGQRAGDVTAEEEQAAKARLAARLAKAKPQQPSAPKAKPQQQPKIVPAPKRDSLADLKAASRRAATRIRGRGIESWRA